MKLRKEIIGIVLAFSAVGVLATKVDAKGYQAVYQQRDPQVQQIEKALSSEFISASDQKRLSQEVKDTNQAEKNETRRELKKRTAAEKKLLATVQKRSNDSEAVAAKSEFTELKKEVTALDKKGQADFVLAADSKKVEELKDNLETVEFSKKVTPIRELADETVALSTEMSDNQTQLIDLVKEMKELNQSSGELAKKNYLPNSDKEALGKDQKENAKFFNDADDLENVTKRKATSQALLTSMQTKQKDTENDFKENESQAKALVQSADSLIKTGNLTAEEKTKLTATQLLLNNALGLKDYEPGDLATNFQSLKMDYDSSLSTSNQRVAAAKKAEQEKAAQEKAAQEKAAAEAAQQQAAASASPASPTVVGGWYQAPAGYKYLKGDSGKTYGQVKNPGNFSLITDSEAAAYTPGHGNGSAKQ